MRRFCGSFLVHGGSGNRPTCSSDKIKIQHRGTPSTPSFCLVSCATLLHPNDYGKKLLEAHHSQLMDITKVFARRALKLKVERQGQLLLSCQLKNPQSVNIFINRSVLFFFIYINAFVAHDASSFMPGPDLLYTSKCLLSVSYTKCSCKVILFQKCLYQQLLPSRLFCMFGPNLTKCTAKVNTISFCTFAVCPTCVYVDRTTFSFKIFYITKVHVHSCLQQSSCQNLKFFTALYRTNCLPELTTKKTGFCSVKIV